MSTHLKNVLMQQSNGPKKTMPSQRPLGELLLALNEFNRYDLYTGTDDSVQPLVADGVGTSNISFAFTQDNAEALNGKFVYFDEKVNQWKLAYAVSNPSNDESFTAQGFAITINSTSIQVTTSGKLIIPFKLTDNTGADVVAGSYYYLCQDSAKSGLIQQAAPASGIKQIVCQILEVSDSSTTLMLLNNLNQVADDIIITDGDGSKYLGDDGQYHEMMIAGLAGRTSNCIDKYEVLDINFENIPAGSTNTTQFTYPALSSNGTINMTTPSDAINHTFLHSDGQWSTQNTNAYLSTKSTNITLSDSASTRFDLRWLSATGFSCTAIKITNSTDASLKSKNFKQGALGYYKDNVWHTTDFIVENPTDKPGATSIIYVPLNIVAEMGVNKIFNISNCTNFDGETSNFALNLIVPIGILGSISNVNGYGYIKNGDVTVENNIASNFNETNYIISKYLLQSYSQYTIRIARKFSQVTNEDPIFQAGNRNNCLFVQNGILNLVLNGVNYKGNLTYTPETTYYFELIYNKTSGYSVRVSTDNSQWTNEILLYDEIDYLNNKTLYIAILFDGTTFTSASGESDLSNSGIYSINNSQSTSTYPLSNVCNKAIATITTTFKGTGIIATGRASSTNTLNAITKDVEFSNQTTIVSEDATDILWDEDNGVVTGTYQEVQYESQYEEDETLINPIVYAKDKNYVYKYTIIYPNILQTAVNFEKQENGDVLVDLSPANSTFHPNKFLDRNNFTFNLKLNLNGDLKLYRQLDARNYGSTQSHPFYYQVQGVDWNTFQSEGNYTQGIKMSSMLGTNNTGTGTNSMYQLTQDTANFWWPTSQTSCGPQFGYFAFEKPIRFTSVLFRGAGSANFTPEKFALHVSNDMNNWYSILSTDSTGYVENGMLGNLPIDAYANFTLTTVNGWQSLNVVMPDDVTYWKYVRLCLYTSKAGIPELSGFWIGASSANTAISTATQTATELILDKQNFINTETSGINAQVIRKKTGTAYQVRFLDKIGYVAEAPEDGLSDVDNNTLPVNDTVIYEDENLQKELTSQTLAYQTRCKKYLKADRNYSYPVAYNPFQGLNDAIRYVGCANTGTVANSWNLLQDTTTGYDFNNATNESSFIITFKNRAIVGNFLIRNNATVDYNPQEIKIYGAINGGSVEGTNSELEGDSANAAIWEEIPIYYSTQVYGNNDFNKYASKELPLTYVNSLCSQNALSGTTGASNYGLYKVFIRPNKAYQQYKISLKRDVNNKVIMTTIIPQDVWFDPFATNLGSDGSLIPLLVDDPYYPTSSATSLPDKASITTGIYTSPYSASTVANLYRPSDNTNWNPGNARNYVTLQQAYPYPINLNNIRIQHGTDTNYAANCFECYGTNLTSLATTALSDSNSLTSWSRLTSLLDRSDMPTILTSQNNNYVLLGRKEYGYSYFTALFARTISNNVLMDFFGQDRVTTSNYINGGTAIDNASIYTEEWKWTNVAGDKDTVRNGACYNHPLLQVGDTSSTTPTYELTTRPQYNPDAFTVVGNPTITEDGVASGFSNEDFITNNTLQNITEGKPWEINIKFKTGSLEKNQLLFGREASLRFNLLASGTLTVGYRVVGEKTPWTKLTGYNTTALTYKMKTNTYYFTKIKFTGEAYEFYISTDNIVYDKLVSFKDTRLLDGYEFGLGNQTKVPTTDCFLGSIDLSLFKIYIDSKEVFSGAYPNTFYTETQGAKETSLPNNTAVYRTQQCIGPQTMPYENRWMYKYTDLEDNIWYSPSAPAGTSATKGSYMYKNIIPKYNKDYATGIPLNATANTGSENGFTYFASSEDTDGPAFNAFSSSISTSKSWLVNNAFSSSTGLPVNEAPYVGFISPTPICVQGYNIFGLSTSTAMTGILQWEFQASNDGSYWVTLDSRDTEKSEDPDTPINVNAGTSYFFDNQKSYTQYRWVINKVPVNQVFIRLICGSLFVLEENPLEVDSIFELSYQNSEGETLKAYTNVSGESGDFIGNNATIYSDRTLQSPITNVWAYEVSDTTNTYYVKTAGESGTYVAESTMVYEDADFTVEHGEALVDTWKYTGTINKKYAYTGTQINNFTYDGEEPYNKYTYTGDIKNQYVYTGKIEGWKYTGVTKDIYDTVPNIKLSLNRENVKKVTKKTLVGMGYPVTSNDSPSSINYYSFTASDIAGAIVPSGTPLYTSLESTTPAVYADGTNTYIFSTAPAESKYSYEHLYTYYKDVEDGTNLTGDEDVFYDVNLTQPAEVSDLTSYYYDTGSYLSNMKEFYHRITENTPVNDYNLSLNFNGSTYTFNAYPNNGVSDIQTLQSGELVKSSYTGADEQTKDNVVIIMKQQNLLKLNLSKSTYSWWVWNNLYEPLSSKTIANMFRLASIDSSKNIIEAIWPLYPWRVGDASNGGSNIYTWNEEKQKFAQVDSATLITASTPESASLPKNSTAINAYIPITDVKDSTSLKIDNVYVVSDINNFMNNDDIPNNTLILGYGGYL